MAEVYGAITEAASAGELDVIRAQDLEHLRTHEARDERHLKEAERDRRQDQGLQTGGCE
jgi:hypothetical protein